MTFHIVRQMSNISLIYTESPCRGLLGCDAA